MPTTKLPDNGHTASQKIALRHLMPLERTTDETSNANNPADTSSSGLHRRIHHALERTAFKVDALGKTGEDLKNAVATAIAAENVLVEIISVGLSDAAATHSTTPYEAVWQIAPGAVHETSYFDTEVARFI